MFPPPELALRGPGKPPYGQPGTRPGYAAMTPVVIIASSKPPASTPKKEHELVWRTGWGCPAAPEYGVHRLNTGAAQPLPTDHLLSQGPAGR